tara:strand:- start:208 stop:678 length:471 start_codon:yes stop_codon:yes gene_type:complete
LSTKRCKACGQQKGLTAFYRRPNQSVDTTCRKCRTVEARRNANASPHAYLRTIINNRRYDAKKKGVVFDIDHDFVMSLWETQGGKCALSNVTMTFAKDGNGNKAMNASLDRIRPDHGYTIKPLNVQLVCARVNIMKHTLPEFEFRWWVQNIHENLT